MSVNEIQTQAAGLLGALNLKGGRPPQNLEDTIRGTIDTAPFYLDQALTAPTAALSSIAATAVGNAVNRVVPANQRWLMYGVMVAIGPIATVTDRIRVRINFNPPDSSVAILAPQEIIPSAVGDDLSQGFLLPRPILLAPGFGVGVVVARITVTTNIPLNIFPLCAVFSA